MKMEFTWPLWIPAVMAVIVTYASFKLVQVYADFRKKVILINQFPGDEPELFWGNLRQYPGPNEAGLAFQRKQTEKYPKIVRGWLGPFIALITVHHPDTVKIILRSSEPKGEQVYNFVRPWLGDGLLVSSGEKWARNRRLLTPAFHFDILKPYMAIYNRCADVLLDKISQFTRNGVSQYWELCSEISLFTLDVILQCAFSCDIDCQRAGSNHSYVCAVREMNQLITDRFYKFWVHRDFLYFLTPDGRRFKKHSEFVHKVAEDIISKRRKELENKKTEQTGSKKCLDFLDILLTARDENGQGLSQLEIRNEVDTFLFEGHDTTASALSWTLFSLAEHPDIQHKVQAEIDEVLAGRDSDDILWEDLQNLKYTTMCVKEGLRLHTPVPFIQRQLTQNLIIDNKTVPKGSLVCILLYNVHHNPSVWPDSLRFIPERFSPENVENRDPFAFVPFSAGPRNCIGQNFAMHEMKLLIARILRRFCLELDPNHKAEKEEQVVMKAKNGIRVRAIPRQIACNL
ncbi:hypothetical protein CHS0354_024413 [Potamilus streckersoni]|uniref:Cytochrome P450 n=1 Tax=Potamilus streckersoni TaxID=2493646 RepID=A0AAE0W3P0_9BIVA|nr:hypothetical protein CHS0354_024413 [Potamilus streckersoni]